jgi:hypothetical protein
MQTTVSAVSSPLVLSTQANIGKYDEGMKDKSTEKVSDYQKRPRTKEEIQERRMTAVKRRSLFQELRQSQKEALICLQMYTGAMIVVMPTGSGKTTLIWAFQHSSKCTFVFAPYAILAQQLQTKLAEKGNSFMWPLDKQKESLEGIFATADFIVLPYEAAVSCKWLLTGVERIGRLGPVFLDEVTPWSSIIVRM